MNATILATGLTVLGLGALAPAAIANETSQSMTSMSDLDMPALEDAVEPNSVTSSRKLAEVLPAGEFTDVSPNHWAYAAVNNLAENYGCIAGYPNGTFQGDRFVTRYEFAAALESCLDTLVQQVRQERQTNVDTILNDLTELERELGTLSDEVEAVESEVSPE